MSRGFSEGFLRSKKDGKDSISLQDKQKLIPSNIKTGVSIKVDGVTVNGAVPDGTLTAGTNILKSGSGISMTGWTSLGTYFTGTVNMPGTIRVERIVKLVYSGDNQGVGYTQIYKNGVAQGTNRTINSTTPVTYTEDIAVNSGDIIEVKASTTGGGNWMTFDSIKYMVGNPQIT